jgi:hypothetical protein
MQHPAGYPNQGWPQPYGAVAPITSGLHVTPNFFFLQWMLWLVKPVVTIGPHKQEIAWGRPTLIPLPPGQYQVKLHFPWIFGEGNPAIGVVVVHPGYATELKYDTSFFVFSKGTLVQRGFRVWGQ